MITKDTPTQPRVEKQHNSTLTPIILRLPEVMRRTGLSRSSIYLRISQGLLPKPISLGSRAVGWPEDEISSINAARIAGKTNAEIFHLIKKLEEYRGIR